MRKKLIIANKNAPYIKKNLKKTHNFKLAKPLNNEN